jgi:chromate transport protein ChrA
MRDLRWRKKAALVAVFSLPPALVLLGLNSFIQVIGLVGGVFLSIQYALIVLVSRKVLRPRGLKRVLADVVMIAFALAALYSVAHFW